MAIQPDALIYNVLGLAYSQKGDIPKAEEAFKHAIQSVPNNAEAYINLADLYMSNGQADLAEQHYRTASTVEPQNKEIHIKLGQLYTQQGIFQNRRKDIERSADISVEKG